MIITLSVLLPRCFDLECKRMAAACATNLNVASSDYLVKGLAVDKL